MIVAGTGHRPRSLGGYSQHITDAGIKTAKFALEQLKPEMVISGMAIGWDQYLAEAALDMEIPLLAAVPFKGQESRWPEETKKNYRNLLRRAKEISYVSEPGYAAWKMQERNRFMVERANYVLALWNGVASGGTWNCVVAAQKRRIPMLNVWEIFCHFRDSPEAPCPNLNIPAL